MNSKKQNIWEFLFKELAKVKTIVDCYNKLFVNIEIKNNRYNPFLQLVLDSFTNYILITIPKFFDKRSDSWSLYKLNGNTSSVDNLRLEAMVFIRLRNRKYAHLDKLIKHTNNFTFLTDEGIKKVNKITDNIKHELQQIGRKNNLNYTYALEWGGIKTSLECLIKDISIIR